jgi:hypothetical protein
MPKKPMDYSKTIIYKLVCNDLNITDLYVGHTTDFKSRKQNHKQSVENINDTNYNCKKATYIREHGGWNAWSMIEIEKFPCNDKQEACARERYWYETLGATLNSRCPIKSSKEYYEDNKEHLLEKSKEYYYKNREHKLEYQKQYLEQNREQLQKYSNEWRKANKNQIQAYKLTKYTCECGSIFTKGNKSSHFKTLKHCQFLETNNI